MSMENHGGMAGETPDSSTRAFWHSYQQEELVKEMMYFALKSIFSIL
jgi:hypothetical protein